MRRHCAHYDVIVMTYERIGLSVIERYNFVSYFVFDIKGILNANALRCPFYALHQMLQFHVDVNQQIINRLVLAFSGPFY